MKTLVTGGAGFIGSHLCEELLRRGRSVTVIDDCSTGREDNLREIRKDPHFRFVQGTIMDRDLMARLIRHHDIVYHLAAAVGVKYVLHDPISAMTTNTHGTEILLELASRFKKSVLLASTSEIYGKHSSDKIKEDDGSVFGPTHVLRWNYAVSKALDEIMAAAYAQRKHLKVITIRFFNVVGPRQSSHYGMVIPRLVEKALNGMPLTVFGDGKQIRTFLHVQDAVRAVADLSEQPSLYGQVFNIGGDEPVTINQLAHRIRELSPSKPRIQHLGYGKFYGDHFEDIPCRIPDVSRLQKAIGFKPEYDLDQILRSVIASFEPSFAEEALA